MTRRLILGGLLIGLLAAGCGETPLEPAGADGLSISVNPRELSWPDKPQTSIRISLPEAAHLRLEIGNAQGEVVRVLADQMADPGLYEFVWNGTDHDGDRCASGVYYLRATALGETHGFAMTLVK
jgi:flagellar hook assembly protein FlgD